MESVRIETDDPVTDLKCQDKIRVLTQNGECSIEYYLGDICCLKPENKVDVLLVSAFRENYDPIKGTLIGALRYQLKLNVAEYALNKAEDLREYYSCWVSHLLPEHLPFKRLLCFEPKRLRTVHPKEVVGDVFRCLVPILQDEVGTVITPILSTGKVGFRETDLMQSMVEAAVNWMKAGLPLKQLKIVQYAVFTEEGEVAQSQRRDYEGIRKLFGELKERYDMQYLMPKETPIEYDIYLSCCKEDRDVSKALLDSLKQAKPDIRVVVGSDQKMMKDESWQEEMYETMMKSARVVTGLVMRQRSQLDVSSWCACCRRVPQTSTPMVHGRSQPGKAWQRLLYHSIDGSTIFIAMVSERYLKSAVCNEEYSLALAKFCTKGDPLQLCVLKTEDTLSLPPEYQGVTTVSAGTDFTDKIETFCSDLVDWSKTKEDSQANESLLRKTQADALVLKDYFVNFDEESSKHRRLCFHDRFPNFLQWLKEGPKVADKKMGKNKSNIAISFHKSDQKYADYISAGIFAFGTSLKCGKAIGKTTRPVWLPWRL
ncbi:hypothetical protein BSL78_09138 [Apostichopus japonicus]|uniref:TIR domain-containing protein n=1 Tax=Stichopus japonicus TaxID=307972 RepID=A0A2G8L0W9_STIJA|nr:hypothetical protein BSL78_09138 [Apostichopus japonicus]